MEAFRAETDIFGVTMSLQLKEMKASANAVC